MLLRRKILFGQNLLLGSKFKSCWRRGWRCGDIKTRRAFIFVHQKSSSLGNCQTIKAGIKGGNSSLMGFQTRQIRTGKHKGGDLINMAETFWKYSAWWLFFPPPILDDGGCFLRSLVLDPRIWTVRRGCHECGFLPRAARHASHCGTFLLRLNKTTMPERIFLPRRE